MKLLKKEITRSDIISHFSVEHEGVEYTVNKRDVYDADMNDYENDIEVFAPKGEDITDTELAEDILKFISKAYAV